MVHAESVAVPCGSGRGRGVFQRKSAPGDVRVLVKLDDERRYPPQKPIILFDLNGTLTSHTSQRRSAGINRLQPGMHHLRRLLVRLPL